VVDRSRTVRAALRVTGRPFGAPVIKKWLTAPRGQAPAPIGKYVERQAAKVHAMDDRPAAMRLTAKGRMHRLMPDSAANRRWSAI
jgi:hypothetical protein